MQLDVIRRISIEAQTKGVDPATAGLNRLAEAQGGVAVASEKQEKSARSIEQVLESQRRAIEQSIRSQQQYAEIINQQTRASQQLVAANDNMEESFSLLGIEAAEAAGHLRTAAGAAYAFSPAFREVVNGMAKPALSAAATALAAVATGMVLATNAAGRGLIELGLVAARSSTALAPIGGTIAMAGAAMAAFNPTVTAVAASILTRLMPAIRALTGIGLVINLVQMLGEAWELGGKKLEEYRQIAEKAAAADLSTEFFQRISKAAGDAKLPVDDLTVSMKRLAEVTQDKLGGSEFQNHLDKLIKAGNFQGNTGVSQLASANTTEEKFRAIVSLVDQAMAKGERLAALDLTSKFLSPAAQAALAANSDYLKDMLASADAISKADLVSDENIGRALELKNRYDDAVKILETRWHPIQDLLTKGGIEMRAAWVSIVEAVAAGVDWVTKLVMKIGELPQGFWDLAKKGYGAALSTAVGAIPGIGTVVTGARIASQVMGAGDQTSGITPDAIKSVTEYGQAVDKLRAGLQNTNAVQKAVAETNAVQAGVWRDTSKAIGEAAKATQQQENAYTRAVSSVEKHIARMEADAKAVGLGVGAQEQFRTEAMLTTAALQAKIPVTKELTDFIDQLSKRAGEAAVNLAKVKVDQDIKFRRQTIGLSSEDVQIAQQLRNIYPDVATALASVEAQEMRLLNAQHMLADGFREVGKEMLSAFLSGKNVMDAMVRSLDNLASKLANAAFDNILSGLRTGNFAQAGLGALQAGASALISAFTGDQKAKKEVEEAKKRFAEMADQLMAFNRAAAGFDLGPLTSEIEALRKAHDSLAMAALEAQDFAALGQIHETLNKGIRRIFNEWMNGVPVLGEFGRAMADLRNEAQGLTEVIPDAAEAIQRGLIDRINALIAATEKSLKEEINTATGFGWLNDIDAAITKFNELNGSVDATLLDRWMTVTLQKIVDDAKLTGEAFQNLITGIPQIAGYIHEYSEALDESGQAALAAAAAQEKANLQLRLLVATTDQSTLAGALAVNALKQQMEMNEAIAANSQNIALLQQVQAAETYNIVKSFADKATAEAKAAAEAQAKALQDAQNAFNGFVRNIRDFINHYLSGTEGGLSPSARLANAQSAYASQLALAQGGDRDALNSITQYFQDLVNASKGFYASSSAGQAINAAALAQLEALPSQISPEQFIVNAIEAASDVNVDGLDAINEAIIGQLSTAVMSGSAQNFAIALLPHFNSLLDPTTGLLKQAQLEAKLNLPDGSLDKIFKELDGNGNGILEKSELIKVAAQGTATSSSGTKTNTDTLPEQATKIAGMETSLLALAQVSNATQSAANLLNDLKSLLTPPYLSSGVGVWGNLRLLVNLGGGTPVATGGLITGPGTGTSDQAGTYRLSNGEFVMNDAARRFWGADNLFAMNSLRMPSFANDNRSFPAFAGGGDSAVVAEIRALRAEVAQLRSENRRGQIAAAEHIADHVDAVSETIDENSRAAKFLAA